MPETDAERQEFIDAYNHTRANANRIPGTVDVVVADCTEENVNWLRSMRKRKATKRDIKE